MASIWDDIVAAVANKEVPLESAVDQIEMMGFPRGTATKIATGELPMDAASREARRVEQNFIDPVYHSGNLEGATEVRPGSILWASDQPPVAASYATLPHNTSGGLGNAGYRLYVNPENYASYNAEGAMWENLEMPLNDIEMPDGTKVPITRVNPDDPTYTSTDDAVQFVTGQRGRNDSVDMDYASGVKIKNVDDFGPNIDAGMQVGEDMGLSVDEVTDLTEGYGMTNYGIVSPESVRLEGAAFDPDNVGMPYLMGAVGNESPGVLDRATSLGGTAADLATQTWDNMSLLEKAALVTSPIPFIGAGTGIAADVMNMVNNPEERTFLNAALLASNFIPGNKIAGAGMAIVDAGKNAAQQAMRVVGRRADDLPGVVQYDSLYHGSTNADLKGLSVDKSQRTEFGALPAISASDDPLLSKAFTRGELGDQPVGAVYKAQGPFKVLDISTPEGRKQWDDLGQDPQKALDAGFDGVQFNNVEEYRIDAFYKDIDPSAVRDAKEVQLFRDVKDVERVGKVGVDVPDQAKVIDGFTGLNADEKAALRPLFTQRASRIAALEAKDSAAKSPYQMRNERYKVGENLSEEERAEYNSLLEGLVKARLAGRTGASADDIAKELLGE